MSDDFQAQWPDCETEGYGGKIYFDPKHRKHCRKRELAGLAPVTELPPLPNPYAASGATT
ncbi:hypothetical protein AB0F91_46430 [Amycolatopsis sp. NPDC023774]|uniref:hypothetical protein n=1 Tax=Amycolatopsis sp. NPDC023774 TaxID=3155015 RepID=UPI0033E7DB0C